MHRWVLWVVALTLCACSADQDSVPPAPTQLAAPAPLPRTPAPAQARVYFITPTDGATVSSPVHIEFGVDNMTIARAGVQTPASGHHHLIINAQLPKSTLPIPADANHIHFGDGSTSTDLELPPGQHTLTLLLGDHLHIPHQPPVHSQPVTITVVN